jgi:hypothetical protein
MGQKMVRFGQLGAARSRQGESIEVGEVGSKRPSLGCNGVHVTWWGPLIARSSGRKIAEQLSATRAVLRHDFLLRGACLLAWMSGEEKRKAE